MLRIVSPPWQLEGLILTNILADILQSYALSITYITNIYLLHNIIHEMGDLGDAYCGVGRHHILL